MAAGEGMHEGDLVMSEHEVEGEEAEIGEASEGADDVQVIVDDDGRRLMMMGVSCVGTRRRRTSHLVRPIPARAVTGEIVQTEDEMR